MWRTSCGMSTRRCGRRWPESVCSPFPLRRADRGVLGSGAARQAVPGWGSCRPSRCFASLAHSRGGFRRTRPRGITRCAFGSARTDAASQNRLRAPPAPRARRTRATAPPLRPQIAPARHRLPRYRAAWAKQRAALPGGAKCDRFQTPQAGCQSFAVVRRVSFDALRPSWKGPALGSRFAPATSSRAGPSSAARKASAGVAGGGDFGPEWRRCGAARASPRRGRSS